MEIMEIFVTYLVKEKMCVCFARAGEFRRAKQ